MNASSRPNQFEPPAFVTYRTNGQRDVASRADEYRRRAQQCLEMAQAFGDRDARRSLCYMAEVWLQLADRYQDAKEVRPPCSSNS